MIQTTNDANGFFADNKDPIYIYGAGNPGRWVAEYMLRCEMDFEGFIDKAVNTDDCIIYNKKIIHPSALHGYGNTRLKIVIAIGSPNEALADLHWFAKNNNLICLLPLYRHYLLDKEDISKDNKSIYNINLLLSYFRNQLIKGEIPTIISNTCIGGEMYQSLGLNMVSPTVNTYIHPKDFIKICKMPKEYFSEDLVFDHWTLTRYGRRPVGKIKDVEIQLVHSINAEWSITLWNRARKWVNWEKLVYVMDDTFDMIPYPIVKEFCELPEKHLCVLMRNVYMNGKLNGAIYLNKECSWNHAFDSAVENWFDLLGWINDEYEI